MNSWSRRFGQGALAICGVVLLAITAVPTALADMDGRALPPPLTNADFHDFDPALAEIGRLLFYDPILSGNRNISCGTCHHHDLATGDGLALGVGEGGEGLGIKRTTGRGDARIEKRVPRNASPMFNLGLREIRVLFHDGRLSVDDIFGNGFNSPAEEYLPSGLKGILAAQALFPLTSETEMAGNPEENKVAGAAYDRIDHVWPLLMERVWAIPAYVDLFRQADPSIERAGDLTIAHVANALGDFINSEWRVTDSAFDRYLAGDPTALPPQAMSGMELFYGKAGCSSCHAGQMMSDQGFHALALPHFGPGRTRVFDPYVRDVGRMAESNRLEDAYRFRTPMLRNVALTGPWGHNGAYATLEGIVRHHLDPVAGFENWQPDMVQLPADERLGPVDFIAFEDSRERARLKTRIDIVPVALDDSEVAELIAFLHALSGNAKGRLGRPETVPSGLPVD
ncbi:Cytochrome c peroxidase [Hoeflea phototrophica DFL-43]|uniref:Cytochrome c peroxidase n=1 Tax=Hoeflea phototrophica (strain DSM 17068 / NCIMB 14078 / DFL-43) TaxID=411684 RepID=A9D847_HOEPD|nr:cytochrome c peroxidase [Hoeflea phototrophica]EDQ33221.1 Cytochrome c peroxidase [Hoeflea phototrophica DFL-43]